MREDAPRLDTGFDAPSFDVPTFDVARFDASRPDAARRDAGPFDFDGGATDAGRDAAPPLDVVMECTALCTRLDTCVEGLDIDECVNEGCTDIQDFIVGPACEDLARDLFRCTNALPCEELAFVDDVCAAELQEFGVACGEL